MRLIDRFGWFATIMLLSAVSAMIVCAQAPQPTPAKTILLDVAGNKLTDAEFVDLRVANRADPATRAVEDDGTIVWRLAFPPQEGTEAPEFSAFKIDGKYVDAADLKGKVVVLNFWFIGCPGCMDELPKLNALAAKYSGNDNVRFIAVATNTAQELRAFLLHQKFDYEHIGSGKPVIDKFKTTNFPRNLIIGRDGKIAYWRSTVRAWNKFDETIQAEIDKQKP